MADVEIKAVFSSLNLELEKMKKENELSDRLNLKMKNRKWVKEDNKDVLYFNPDIFPYNEIKLAEVYCEDGDWFYSSSLLYITDDYLGSDTLEDAKEDIESMIENYYEGEINYYKEMLESFLEK